MFSFNGFALIVLQIQLLHEFLAPFDIFQLSNEPFCIRTLCDESYYFQVSFVAQFSATISFYGGHKVIFTLTMQYISPTVPEMNLWGWVAEDFYRPDALPVTQPTPSTHWRKLKAPTLTRKKSPTGLIFPSLITRLLRSEALLPLCQLSDAGTKAIITDKISAMLPHTLTNSNGKRSWKIRLILAPPESSLVLISDPAPSILFSRSCPNVVIILLQYTHQLITTIHTWILSMGQKNKTLYTTATLAIQTLKHHDIYSITL